MTTTKVFKCYDDVTDTIPALVRAYPCCGHYLPPSSFACTWSCSGANCVASGYPTVPTAGTLVRNGPCSNLYINSGIPVYFVYEPSLCPDKEGNRTGLQAFGPGMTSGSGWCNDKEFHASGVCNVAAGIVISIEVHAP